MDNAHVRELGPGIGITEHFDGIFLINSYPGSEIKGVPASVTNEIFCPLLKSAKID